MRVLITGGAGFIGSHLADALIKDGHQVAIIDDLSTGRAENFAHLQAMPQFQFAVETIDNETVMDRMVSECDVIYHLAAAVGVELIINRPVEVIERCVLGTDSVLRVAARYRKKVILTSTSEIYGKNTKVPFDEEADRILGPTTRSRWSYSCAKAIDEFLALAFHKERHLPIVITRLAVQHGRRGLQPFEQPRPHPFVTQVDHRPTPRFMDHLHRLPKRLAGGLGRVVKNIAEQVLAVHPHQHGFINRHGSAVRVQLA